MLDKVFLQTRVLISRAKSAFRSFLETKLVSSDETSNVSSFAFKLSTFLYTLSYERNKDTINDYYVSVILNPEFSFLLARRKLSPLRSARAYRRRLYFAALSRQITAARCTGSPFSTRSSRISFPRFDLIPSVWEEETSSLSREIDVLSENTKGSASVDSFRKIIPLNTE